MSRRLSKDVALATLRNSSDSIGSAALAARHANAAYAGASFDEIREASPYHSERAIKDAITLGGYPVLADEIDFREVSAKLRWGTGAERRISHLLSRMADQYAEQIRRMNEHVRRESQPNIRTDRPGD